jgi:hypothetical protein
MKSTKCQKMQHESNWALEEAAYDYPEEIILGYIFNQQIGDTSKIEDVININHFLAERIEDLRCFLEMNNINSKDEYRKFITLSSDTFMNSFSFATVRTNEFKNKNTIKKGFCCDVLVNQE